MVAKVILVGNLGRAPEIKSTDKGKKFARFSVAVPKYANKERTTMWVDVVCWNEKIADRLEAFAGKGSKLYIEGSLEKRSYTKDGQERTVFEVNISPFSGEVEILTRSEAKEESKPEAIDDSMPF
jgi:single-strand DNA-binding protein